VILVDTSAWIEFFRGRGRLAEQVDELLETDDATLCGPVVTELRRGLRSRAERTRVLPLLSGCRVLDQPVNLWEEAGVERWGRREGGVEGQAPRSSHRRVCARPRRADLDRRRRLRTHATSRSRPRARRSAVGTTVGRKRGPDPYRLAARWFFLFEKAPLAEGASIDGTEEDRTRRRRDDRRYARAPVRPGRARRPPPAPRRRGPGAGA